MEDMVVVFFYVDKRGENERKGEQEKRKKRRGKKEKDTSERDGSAWKYNVKKEKRELGVCCLNVWWVGLPNWDRKGKGSNVEDSVMHEAYIRGLPIPPEGRYVYYAMDKPAEHFLGRAREPIGMEWILFFIAYYGLQSDGLVLFQDREMEAEELIRHFAPKISYLGIVTDFYFDWNEVEENLSEEYGLVLDIGTDFENLHIKGERLLVIGGADASARDRATRWIVGERKTQHRVPRECQSEITWIDVAGRGSAYKMLREDAQNVRYINMEHFLRDTLLDTAHKIKYNNTR